MSQYGWDGCPPDGRRQVDRLIAGLQTCLAGNLTGVYLHGSLAMACFNPARSDVDLLVVARQAMPVETKRDLAALLLDVSCCPSPVEISCLCHADLVPWRYPTPFDFHYSEMWRDAYVRDLAGDSWRGWNAVRRDDEDLAAHITITRRRGVCLYGPPVGEVFPVVPRRDFLASVLGDVLSPEFGLDAVAKNPVYVVLNACRTLAYLRSGEILSKDEGGAWALLALPGRFHSTLVAALDAYRDFANDGGLSKEPAAEFAAYMRGELAAELDSKGLPGN
jgi:Aminoglycoside adenylyltransferase, C-terminal domain